MSNFNHIHIMLSAYKKTTSNQYSDMVRNELLTRHVLLLILHYDKIKKIKDTVCRLNNKNGS